MALTRMDVEAYLGELSDEFVDRILAMGLTRPDLAEVARQIESSAGDEDGPDEATVEELCRLMRDDEGEEVWADY